MRHFFGRATPGAGKQWTFGVLSPLPVSPLNSGGSRDLSVGGVGSGGGNFWGWSKFSGTSALTRERPGRSGWVLTGRVVRGGQRAG